MTKRRQAKLSPELLAMFKASAKLRKQTKPMIQGINIRLERAANRLLPKELRLAIAHRDGQLIAFFPLRVNNSEIPVLEAEAIGSHGLKPTWHGTV
jgi:hypothetical protein